MMGSWTQTWTRPWIRVGDYLHTPRPSGRVPSHRQTSRPGLGGRSTPCSALKPFILEIIAILISVHPVCIPFTVRNAHPQDLPAESTYRIEDTAAEGSSKDPTEMRIGRWACWEDSYSARIAWIGSTRVALCAGTNAARVAAAIRTTGATVNAIGS